MKLEHSNVGKTWLPDLSEADEAVEKEILKKTTFFSVKKAAEKWPDSKSRAFKIKEYGTGYSYFLIDTHPKYVNDAKVRSSAQAFKIGGPMGVIVTNIHITQTGMTIIPLTFAEFIEECRKEIKLINDALEDKGKEQNWDDLLLAKKSFEQLGFEEIDFI